MNLQLAGPEIQCALFELMPVHRYEELAWIQRGRWQRDDQAVGKEGVKLNPNPTYNVWTLGTKIVSKQVFRSWEREQVLEDNI